MSQGHAAHAAHEPSSEACRMCPVCVLLQAFGDSRPEVTQHLVAAGRELALAVKAMVDAGVEAAEDADPPSGLRRIRVE